jgi:hypothetical protein
MPLGKASEKYLTITAFRAPGYENTSALSAHGGGQVWAKRLRNFPLDTTIV